VSTMKRSIHEGVRARGEAHGEAAGPRELEARASPRRSLSDTVGELWIYDVIGEDWWTGGGVTAQEGRRGARRS
jgi:hypothetical protein